MNRLGGRDVPAMAQEPRGQSNGSQPVDQTAAGVDDAHPVGHGRWSGGPIDATGGVMTVATRAPSVARFWGKVNKTDACWLWGGAVDAGGYGRVMVDGIHTMAHRVAYALLRGPIPDGLQLDHLCRVRLCVNPEHLEPVTRRVNILRGVGPTAINAAKTHCIRGHEFTPENTTKSSTGNRACRECIRAWQRRNNARKRAAA